MAFEHISLFLLRGALWMHGENTMNVHALAKFQISEFIQKYISYTVSYSKASLYCSGWCLLFMDHCNCNLYSAFATNSVKMCIAEWRRRSESESTIIIISRISTYGQIISHSIEIRSRASIKSIKTILFDYYSFSNLLQCIIHGL